MRRTQEWMAAQAPRADGAQWSTDDAQRLVEKVARLDARRKVAGMSALRDTSREHALALQFKGFGSKPYTNHCWSCGAGINSEINARCDSCNMFFCEACGACMWRRN